MSAGSLAFVFALLVATGAAVAGWQLTEEPENRLFTRASSDQTPTPTTVATVAADLIQTLIAGQAPGSLGTMARGGCSVAHRAGDVYGATCGGYTFVVSMNSGLVVPGDEITRRRWDTLERRAQPTQRPIYIPPDPAPTQKPLSKNDIAEATCRGNGGTWLGFTCHYY